MNYKEYSADHEKAYNKALKQMQSIYKHSIKDGSFNQDRWDDNYEDELHEFRAKNLSKESLEYATNDTENLSKYWVNICKKELKTRELQK